MLNKILFKNAFNKRKLINWKRPDDLELYRYDIEQKIINVFYEPEFLFLYNNYNKKSNEKIIIIIDFGYSKWLINFIEKHKKEKNNFSIFNLDFNNTFDFYLNYLKDVENNIKNDLIDIGIYCEPNDPKRDFSYFNNESVHYVYQKNMITVFNHKKWILTINEIHRVLKKTCNCEFLEYDFKIKNIEYDDISYKINKYIEKEINKININIVINEINKKFDNIKINKIKIPLYKEFVFNGICIENVILGYSQFRDKIIKMLKLKYNIELNYDELKDILIYEWEKGKSYIEFYIINCIKK